MSNLMIAPVSYPKAYFGNENDKKEPVKATIERGTSGTVKIILTNFILSEDERTYKYRREKPGDKFELKKKLGEKYTTKIQNTGLDWAYNLFKFLGEQNQELAVKLAEQMQTGDIQIEFVAGEPNENKTIKGSEASVIGDFPFDVQHSSRAFKEGELKKKVTTHKAFMKGNVKITGEGVDVKDKADGILSLIGQAIRLNLQNYLEKRRNKGDNTESKELMKA